MKIQHNVYMNKSHIHDYEIYFRRKKIKSLLSLLIHNFEAIQVIKKIVICQNLTKIIEI